MKKQYVKVYIDSATGSILSIYSQETPIIDENVFYPPHQDKISYIVKDLIIEREDDADVKEFKADRLIKKLGYKNGNVQFKEIPDKLIKLKDGVSVGDS